ncbi:hypothetical protein LY76DRAFT_52048 [Colletotrichum caudatum]|nr:hypothetical protein LY76DRAFT_52048 [Colletotrichum caudatum]
MKSHLRSSQPTSPRHQHQPLESAASPSHRPDTPFQRKTTMRRPCQDPARCLGPHSHLVQVPRPAAVGLGAMRQKRARPRPTETGTPTDKRRRAELGERQQAPDRPAEKGSPDAYDSQIEEAFRELLDKLVRWEISTPEDAQALKEELGEMAGPPVPAPPAAEAEEKRPSGPDAVGDEIRPGARGPEEGCEKEQEEARREADSLAFEVVDASEAEDAGDEFCCVFEKETPADVDGEYVLL